MKKPTPKWQVIENVVAALERVRARVPGLRITQRAQLPRIADPTMTRDVDVLVETDAGGETLRTCIEVKNKHRPLSIEQMGCIADLARDVAHDRFCMVSTSGFSAGARVKAAENAIQLTTLEEFERSEFWAYPPKVMVVTTGGHLIYTEFDFAPDDLLLAEKAMASSLQDARPEETILEDATGTVTVPHFMQAKFQEHLCAGGRIPEDGAVVTLSANMTNRSGLSIVLKGVRLPGPRTITSWFRYSRYAIEVPERRFRLDDIEISTTEMRIGDRDLQVSLAKVPQADGSTQIVMSQGPARPPKARR